MSASDLPDHEDDSEILDPIHAGFSNRGYAENLARTDADEKVIAGARKLDEARDKLLERQNKLSSDVSKIRESLESNKAFRVGKGIGKGALAVAAMTPQGKVLADKILDLEAKRLQNIREDGFWQPVGAYYDFKAKRFDKKTGNITFKDDNGNLHVGSALKIDRDIRETDKKKWDKEVGEAKKRHLESNRRDLKYKKAAANKKNSENIKVAKGGDSKTKENIETSKESADKAKDSIDKIKSGDKETSSSSKSDSSNSKESSSSNKETSNRPAKKPRFNVIEGGKHDNSPRR